MLVRGGKASEMRVWPEDERRYEGNLLSDHAPVELQLLARVRRREVEPPPLEPARPEPAPAPTRPKDDEEREDGDGDGVCDPHELLETLARKSRTLG